MKIITVSYRLPVSLKKENRKPVFRQSDGGLATALLSYSEKSGYPLTWIGVADFDESLWKKAKKECPVDFELEPVFLDKHVNRRFYGGFSNSILWALFHYFPSFIEYSEEDFEAYKTVNDVIAQKIDEIYKPGDIIWIHDYHFLGLPALVRKRQPKAPVGFFLHIPFPDFEMFRILPDRTRRYLLEGILGSNLAGFHTWDDTIHFSECIEKILGITHRNFFIDRETHHVQMGAFPISIDFNKFHNAYYHENVVRLREEIRGLYEEKKIIFSVDRLDYTKGVNNRLNAFENFLIKYPEWREKVVFLLIIIPSREGIGKYKERKRMIELNISRINGTLGNYKWTPVVYQYQPVNFDKLIALYTSADIALITPIRDGMNLVAKEYVASRRDKRGVLILSIMAGAAKELQEAIAINPLDTLLISDMIANALVMDSSEQEARMEKMQKYLRKYDVTFWANDFLRTIEEVYRKDTHTLDLDGIQKENLLKKFSKAGKRLLLLDLDGTLIPFKSRPELAVPDQELLDLLKKLGQDPKTDVWIISGRSRDFLEKWFGDLPIGLVAEHGGYIRYDEWESVIQEELGWKNKVTEIMQKYTDIHSESLVEIKEFGVAWHYRQLNEERGFLLSRELLGLLKSHLFNAPVQVIDGKKVIEVKHFLAHKGTTCRNYILGRGHDLIIAFGDDKTDEDLFEWLTGENEISVKVGRGSTVAKYRVESVSKVHEVLEELYARSLSPASVVINK
ncbi:MAG: bifunctional alpha,alpha-trehalose-phosphate synthase (UDP-forming)/trehalose-phosphatase [Flavobacteriia bacterium]|nr:bifunctional alpha,alpha-trehalose-phosphate synthase (UDP-forming)/trehalose-phosphatase [Flavobacteriia bacterium]OJX36721.1 MAG: hypothetical protein BGO87_13080 [Flavobacteriia bacterium 40-80]